MSEDHTLQELRALAPWHFDVELRGGLRSAAGNKPRYDEWRHRNVSVVDPFELEPLLRRIYPGGLQSKSFLDVACNSGGYCFVAKSLGAANTIGFDAREHWIKQAEFLKANWTGPTNGMEFQCCSLDDVELERQFDICMFKGILYHLPDPVSGLRRVADRTREIMIVDSATLGRPGELCLRLNDEGMVHSMSGVYGLAWWPSGPDLISHILKWLGFVECRTIFWQRQPRIKKQARRGRCRVIGARTSELLAAFDREEG